jgi:hypothetical protein
MLINSILAVFLPILSLLSITNAFPSSNATLNTRATCSPNKPGCSACSECAVLTYTTSPAGCGALSPTQPPWYTVSKKDGNCQNLVEGMTAAMVTEITSGIAYCHLWGEKECWGTINRVGPVGSCVMASPGNKIWSVSCVRDA